MTASGARVIDAVLFDFSGTLFRLEEDPSWFVGVHDHTGAPVDGTGAAELMRRMTAPVGESVEFDDATRHAWRHRDLDPVLHRQAYLHVLHQSGITDPLQAASVYARVIDADSWTPYPDVEDSLRLLAAQSVRVGVLSNIAFDIRPAFACRGLDRLVDEFVLSFEVGHVKPEPEIFRHAVAALGVDPARTLMVGDSVEADGAAREIGCRFALVDPLPTSERPAGLLSALSDIGLR